MKESDQDYEDYVQPPQYVEYVINKDNNKDLNTGKNELMIKLEKHINNDLVQINSVYDIRIKELGENKEKKIKELEKEYDKRKKLIDVDRKMDIEKYQKEAETKIGELIMNLNKPEDKKSFNIFDWIYPYK